MVPEAGVDQVEVEVEVCSQTPARIALSECSVEVGRVEDAAADPEVLAPIAPSLRSVHDQQAWKLSMVSYICLSKVFYSVSRWILTVPQIEKYKC